MCLASLCRNYFNLLNSQASGMSKEGENSGCMVIQQCAKQLKGCMQEI
jgi:hypothetical protein